MADRIVRTTKRQPLLLIRAKGSHPDMRAKRILKKVLVPLDGSARSEAIIPFIMTVSQSLRMEVTLLRVVAGTDNEGAAAETYLQNCCCLFEDKDIRAGYEVKTGSAAEAIIDLADDITADMVAMSTRGQSAVNIMSLGSVARKVLLAGNTPLLLVRA